VWETVAQPFVVKGTAKKYVEAQKKKTHRPGTKFRVKTIVIKRDLWCGREREETYYQIMKGTPKL
jgi:L,D-peptidoglycan transpeptidase YkuD (ErfK/YbiS/YcfS/YnhG family)